MRNAGSDAATPADAAQDEEHQSNDGENDEDGPQHGEIPSVRWIETPPTRPGSGTGVTRPVAPLGAPERCPVASSAKLPAKIPTIRAYVEEALLAGWKLSEVQEVQEVGETL